MHHLKRLFALLLLMAFCATAATSHAQAPPNLLRNPGFEGGYFAWAGIPEAQVAHEWTPWWIEDVNHNPRWHRPEWKRALKSQFPDRVLRGDSAQQYFTFYASHYAGMYQQVFDVTPGKTYRFSLWVQVWSSNEDNADNSVDPANPRFQIGIDPTGAALPGFARAPGTIVWSGEAPMVSHIDQWGLMTVDVVAKSDTITVYMRSTPDFANKHNDIYVDEASLIEVGGAPAQPVQPAPTQPPAPTQSPAQPQPTSVPPTAVPTTPPTRQPTATPEPTQEPSPQPTATATATSTHTPTSEPTQTHTATPEPTATATTTPTAEPTAIAQLPDPTNEPDPTATAPPPTAETNPPNPTSSPSSTTSPPAEDNNSFQTGVIVGGLTTIAGLGAYLALRRRQS